MNVDDKFLNRAIFVMKIEFYFKIRKTPCMNGLKILLFALPAGSPDAVSDPAD